MQLSAQATGALADRARRARVTLTSVLSAAMALAVHTHLYRSNAVPIRGLTFANLRPYLKPPVSSEHMGCYISMIQYTLALTPGQDLWAVAQRINADVYAAARRGHKFITALLSPQLIQISKRLRLRLGTTALTYTGPTPLQPWYGKSRVVGVHGFVSNNVLGAQYAATARMFDRELWWDVMYVEPGMDGGIAAAIAEELKRLLERAAGDGSGPGRP